MTTFDFLHIDAGIVNGRIVGKAGGALGGMMQSYVDQFYMTAYGDINPCDFNPINFGNVRDMSIQAIWKKMVSHSDFSKRYPTCRMQSKSYRKKYIDTIPQDMMLPVPIEMYDNISKEASLVSC